MKKSLLALALLASFAGAASAQSSLTIYGVADVGIQRSDTDESGVDSTWGVNSGMQSGSRIGFRGTEDLGSGLSALFQLENGFNVDTGGLAESNTLFNRQAFVGLKGGFGTVALGRQYTSLHLAVDSIDPFGTGLSGDMERESIFAAGSLLTGRNNTNNAITYTTPDFSGFSARVIYGFGEVAGSNADGQEVGVSVGYGNGPVNAILAYHRANGGSTSTYTFGETSLLRTSGFIPPTTPTTTAVPIGRDVDAETIFLGGTYNFGMVKAHAAIAQDKLEADIGDEKQRDYMLGVSAPIGAGTVLASWNRADLREADLRADRFALGYTHNLSKRTNLYTSVGWTKDERTPVADDDEVKRTDFRVGVRHLF